MGFTKNDRIEQFRHTMKGAFNAAEVMGMERKLDSMGFFEAPASVSHHGNRTGGLFDHSLAVTNALLSLTRRLELKWERPRSPYVVGMFHDLCKCDNYRMPDGVTDREAWEYNNASILPGHGEKSVIMAYGILNLTKEEIICIRWHMGAFDEKENWNRYGQAITQYPNVLYTHTADMMAARISGV